MKEKILCLFLYFITTDTIYSQLNHNNTKWMEYLEGMTDDEAGAALLEDLFDDLSYLAENPFDLHTVQKEDLERLPFLTAAQIENILYYIYRYKPLQSIYELRNVHELDIQTIEYLLPFVRFDKQEEYREGLTPKRVLKYARQEVLLRYDRCLQEKAGYRNDSPEEKEAHPSRYYLGSADYLSMKYDFRYKDRIQCGLVAEKDAGEAFANDYHKGFDYYSAHFSLKDVACIKHLLLGDYRLSFGQGLVMNTDFTLNNASDVMNVGKRGGGIKRHFSTGEANHLRGGAVGIKVGNVLVGAFYSQRFADASADDSLIYSIKKDGYRRTVNDLQKKNNAQTRIVGGNLQWGNDYVSCGLTALYHDFSGKRLEPEFKPYNVFYLRGKSNSNLGFDYAYRHKKVFLHGETAMSGNGAFASQNILQVYPASFFNFVLRHRYFATDYQAYYGSVAGSADVQNTNAWYLGCTVSPLAYWKISASVDFIEYPWLKYLVDSPSNAKWGLVSFDYDPGKSYKMNLRYTFREKMKNVTVPSQPTKRVLPCDLHGLRYQLHWTTKSGFYGKLECNGKLYKSAGESADKGLMFAKSWGYSLTKIPAQAELYTGYFLTDGWDTRISAYEKSILHAFSIPSFSGEGMRTCTTLKWNTTDRLTCYVKLAWTHYTDRDRIGSGAEAIDGRDKVDFYGLLRLKL